MLLGNIWSFQTLLLWKDKDLQNRAISRANCSPQPRQDLSGSWAQCLLNSKVLHSGCWGQALFLSLCEWVLDVVLSRSFGWFFPQPQIISSHVFIDNHYDGSLSRYLGFPLSAPSLWPSVLQILTTLVSGLSAPFPRSRGSVGLRLVLLCAEAWKLSRQSAGTIVGLT